MFVSPRITFTVCVAVATILCIGGAALALTAGQDAVCQAGIEQQASALAGSPVQLERQQGAPEFEQRIAGYRDAATGDAYLVDELNQRVVAFHDVSALDSLYQGQSGESLDKQELESSARNYLAAHLPVRWDECKPELQVWRVGETAEGATVTEARMVFREYLGEVATCNFVELTMNPVDGAVAAVLISDGPIDVQTTVPRIPAQAAVKTLVDAAQMFGSRVDLAEILIWRLQETGDAHLTWHVVLRTGDGATKGAMAEGYIDALSGELLFYAF